ncbi:hypothetical protein BN165_1040034 [Clostridioides difficile E1]|nr:hypothetical protein BN163_1130036 [Clostridioides difficile T5]CCK94165.1 hypothetical protein BN165_1040034 [Clostridioides difficile E1]
MCTCLLWRGRQKKGRRNGKARSDAESDQWLIGSFFDERGDTNGLRLGQQVIR